LYKARIGYIVDEKVGWDVGRMILDSWDRDIFP
jgi:hypothetical protein